MPDMAYCLLTKKKAWNRGEEGLLIVSLVSIGVTAPSAPALSKLRSGGIESECGDECLADHLVGGEYDTCKVPCEGKGFGYNWKLTSSRLIMRSSQAYNFRKVKAC